MMQKRRWKTVGLMRKMLSCAICTIAMMALLSVHLHVFPPCSKLPDPYRLPHPCSDRNPNCTKLWKPPPNRNYMPCTQPSPNYTSPSGSRGYLLAHTNGGLNQMRAGICDMVAIARIINATLVVPKLDKKSYWQDSSNFSDVFDEDHFINALANDVKVIKKLPKEIGTMKTVKYFKSWSGMDYYQEEIASMWADYKVIRAAKTDSRLANNNLPPDIQKLRCRACYEALRFAPQIEAMGKLLVDRMRSHGPYVSLHLRYEKDMLAFSGCTHDLSPAEANELKMIRDANDNWKVKDIDPREQRSKGFCPLTPKEAAIFLSALGYPSNTPIYIAAGEIYGGDSHMGDLQSRYPMLMRKETLASFEELEPFTNHLSQLAALDYIVSVESDVFMPTYSGNMARAVEGHRRFLGHRRTISPDRKALVRLFDKIEQGKLKEGKYLSDHVIESHRKRHNSVALGNYCSFCEILRLSSMAIILTGKAPQGRGKAPFLEQRARIEQVSLDAEEQFSSRSKCGRIVANLIIHYHPLILQAGCARMRVRSADCVHLEFSSKARGYTVEATMGASFLSTLPSLVSVPSLTISTTPTTRCPSHPVAIRCHKMDTDVPGENVLRRREVLKCFGATVGMELLASSGSFVEMASAADLIQRRQRSEFQSSIRQTLSAAIKGKPELVPYILTLALNDAITYDKATKSGGPNGSIRFRFFVKHPVSTLVSRSVMFAVPGFWMLNSEISRPENKGLSAALNLIEEAKEEIDSYSKGGPISFADLIPFAGQSAVKATFLASAIRKCGGNEQKGSTLYSAYGSSGQWGLFDRQFGRTDSQEPDPEGRVPQWEKATVQEMKDKFSSIGFGPRQLAVMSAFLGPDQAATEALLATDPDVTPWVQKYQRSRETVSQTDYEVDLITTLTKLSSMGQQINYEAYTYPVRKIELSKLKL
ncbi:hypothetical protein POTOM_019487 [Populus tomentosa]|uniref:O-fucosyltransferase family protein n=1 Tax=Populus tomentosa TaxID=118781 RepID=A0A8X8D342_POPTO|nr:hypothetical protein POTOM_019487 [Populus tomentosa]